MKSLNRKPYLFRQPLRRHRVAILLGALAVLTILNVAASAAMAQDDTFEKLGDRPGLVGRSLSEDGRGRFTLVGGSESFELVRTGRKATIRFLCSPSPNCTDVMRTPQPLTGEPTGRGDIVFKSRGGMTVLRVTATGGATLFGGAPFVPASVPRTGRAVVATN